MIGNPVNYDKKFKDNFPIFPAKFDPELKKYLSLLNGKEVLDLELVKVVIQSHLQNLDLT